MVDYPSEYEPLNAATSPAGMELVWIVAPICVAIVLILLIILIIIYLRWVCFRIFWHETISRTAKIFTTELYVSLSSRFQTLFIFYLIHQRFVFIIFFAFAHRKRSCKKQPHPIGATKVLLPPGELLTYSHDPVELRRLNFQTPGKSLVDSWCVFLWFRLTAMPIVIVLQIVSLSVLFY